jgi:SAM-dependent methyltransferase
MIDEPDRSRVFGSVADEYDRVRPGYPPEMIADILAYAPLSTLGALEVGAGTGKATLAFLDYLAVLGHNLSITAVEPDAQMAAVLTRRVKGRDVAVRVTTFEDYRLEQRFGLLYCAQAWHWTDPAVRWELAARALAPGGAAALFWNRDRLADPAVADRLRTLHDACAPGLWREPEPIGEGDMDWPELLEQEEFGEVVNRLYTWQRNLSTADYVANLGTLSPYLVQPAEVRDALFAVIVRELDDRIIVAQDTQLYLARRR